MNKNKYVVKVECGYFCICNEMEVILDYFPGIIHYARIFDNKNQAQEVAEQIGGEVEEL